MTACSRSPRRGKSQSKAPSLRGTAARTAALWRNCVFLITRREGRRGPAMEARPFAGPISRTLGLHGHLARPGA
eukprot:9815323-Alexandrium_andersonii.AAC.1